jgi:ACS family hexuronate transporter-like MFS transporter
MKKNQISPFQKKILILIFAITILNFIDRGAISFAIKPIEEGFGITNAQFGLISAAFGFGYLFTTVFGGILVDRFGTIGVWAIGATLWSIATMLLGLGQGFWSFLALRIFLGVAEGVHFPALLRTVVNWLPLHFRARAISVCLSGVPFASLIGAPLVTTLIDGFGWRIMFLLLGSLGIFWAGLWLFHFRKHPHVIFSSTKPVDLVFKKGIPWKKLIFNPSFLTASPVFFAFGYTLAFGVMWLPGYLIQTHDASIKSTGFLVLPPWMCAAFFMLAGGWLSDRLFHRTRSLRISRSFLIGFGALFSGLCFIPIAFFHDLTIELVWMSLGIGIIFLLNAPVYALIGDLFGPFSGIVQGLFSAVFALALILSPSITGWLVQETGNFQVALFLVAGISIVTSVVLLLFQRPDRDALKNLSEK